jgi:hypothetical protein
MGWGKLKIKTPSVKAVVKSSGVSKSLPGYGLNYGELEDKIKKGGKQFATDAVVSGAVLGNPLIYPIAKELAIPVRKNSNPNSVAGKVASGIVDPVGATKTNVNTAVNDVQNAWEVGVGDQWKKLWGQLYPQMDTSTTIGNGSWNSAGGANQGPYDAATTQRFKDYADRLNGIAQGKGDSIAANQAMASQDRNVKQMAANYAAAPQTALGTRNVMNQQALAGQNIARDAATARLGEINAANQDYGNLLGKMGGDQATMTQSRERIAADMAKAQADLDFQAKKAKADAAGRIMSGILEGGGKVLAGGAQ